MLGAQLKGKFIAYVRTLWQLENYIQNKNNFIKVVTVPKLWSPNHILEVIFQMCHFERSTVAKFWVESCSLTTCFHWNQWNFGFSQDCGGNVQPRPRPLERNKELWWIPLFCNLNLERFVLIWEGFLFVGKIAVSSTNTNVIFCKCPWAMNIFCRKI